MKYFYTFILSFISILTFSQSNEVTYFYRDSTDQLFWNKSKPIYLWISHDNKEFSELNPIQPEASPLYFDTEGPNFIRTKWLVNSKNQYVNPKQEALFKIIIDSKPPVSTASFIAKDSYTYNGKVFYTNDLKVKLTAKDQYAGVHSIYYSLDSSNYIKYTESIHFGSDSNFNIKFYAIDNVGNKEEISNLSYIADNNNLKFSVDASPPETILLSKERIFSSKDKIELKSSDKGVGTFATIYKIDTGDFKNLTDFVRLSNLKSGEHVLYYYSIDRINNTEKTKQFRFFIDNINPSIEINEKIAKNSTTSTLRLITVSCNDNLSGIKNVKIQTSDTTFNYDGPFHFDLKNTLTIQATDSVNNVAIRTIENRIK